MHKNLRSNRLSFLFSISLLIGLFLSASCQSKNYEEALKSILEFSVPTLSPAQLDSIILENKEFILIDNRSEKEYLVSHIPGAIWIPYGLKMNWINFVGAKKNTPVIFYCSVGYRSEKTGELALKAGLRNVYNLYGGIFLWNNFGYSLLNNENKITNRIHGYNKKWSKWIKKGEISFE